MNVTVSNDGSMMIRCLPFGDSLVTVRIASSFIHQSAIDS